MRLKRVLAVKNRKKVLLRTFLVVMLAGVFLLFVKSRKELLVREASHFLQDAVSHESDLDVKIGKISGKLTGRIQFSDVKVEDPALPASDRTLFSAKEIEFRYRLLDFLSKRFNSKVEITVKTPDTYWRPEVRIKSNRFPALEWLRRLALAQKNNLKLRVENLTLHHLRAGLEFSGIRLDYQDDAFQMQIPLHHLNIGGSDVSSVLNIHGRFEASILTGDSVRGEISTEGTVVNWNPLSQESRFDFVLSRDEFELLSSDFLGGIELKGRVNFKKDGDVNFSAKAQNYPLSNFGPFMKLPVKETIPGRLDLAADFHGDPAAPQMEIAARIHEGWAGKAFFKAMDVHVEGVYPTVRLTDSRMLLKDGSVMKFADKVLEVKDLFSDKTYHELVSEAQQDNVVWGDWEFRRPKDINDQPEFLMQRSLSDRASLHLKKYNDSDSPDPSESKPTEVGFEYRLRSKDSLKLELRDNDEKFVGIERKMKF